METMKKITLFLLAASLTVQLSAAVPYRHHVSVSAGILTHHDLGTAIGVLFPTFFALGTPDDIQLGGSYNLSYDFSLTRYWSVGLTTGINLNSYRYKTVGSDEFRQYDNRYLFVMPNVACRWFHRDRLSLYSSLAVGADFYRETEEEGVAFTWHANLFGMEYFFGHLGWGRHLGLFAESGFGSRGIANFGIRGRF